jgi:hypothetical protein
MSGDLSPLQERLSEALRERQALASDAAWRAFAEQNISGNSRLSPVEQLEIYREQFWLRHTSSLVEDFPGLGGILGQADWERLVEEYLCRVAPDSYTLRDLGARLPEVIEAAGWLPHQRLCLDMARLELAYIDVFDAQDVPPLAAERLGSIPEESFADARLVVAPSVRLLRVGYPVADLRRRLRALAESDEAVAIPAADPQQLVVYRRNLRLWDMQLGEVAFAFLSALADGSALGSAAEIATPTAQAESELTQNIGGWLAEWTTKGLIADIAL